MIEVVSAVIVERSTRRVLLTQRPRGKDYAWLWECPGGKVDLGESHAEALRRELLEEVGVDAQSIAQRPIWSGEFKTEKLTRPDRAEITLFMYAVRLDGRLAPTPREGQGLGWFTVAEMVGLSLAPGNQRALSAILDLVRGSAPAGPP